MHSLIRFHSCLTVSSRYRKPNAMQYRQATIPASVAVNQPSRMPPITMTIIRMQGIASRKIFRVESVSFTVEPV